MSPRRRLALGGLVVAALAVLAVGSFVVINGRGDSGTTPPTAAGSPASAPAVDTSASPPELKNTGEDWDQIVRSILGYQAWLFTHPRVELLDNVMLRSYDGYSQHQLGLTNLATKGWRYDPQFYPASVELVRLQDRPRTDLAVVFVRSTGPANRVVDATGKLVQDIPATGEVSVLWTLQRSPISDVHWRIAGITAFSDQPPRP